ncbi:MAG: phosphate ABC transporter substrate-binding protein PstS [Acidobacteriota bacterium]|nr:MAG: phosphate ABC transporter substrate-binding protein PstS [Acidobacteriota bacterium]
MNKIRNFSIFAAIVAFVMIGFACSGAPLSGTSDGGDGSGAMRLQGSGASFPKPIYEKWVNEYQKVDPNVRIDYQSTGSGAGQKAILSRTVDFGASDDPMKDEDLSKADGELMHIPTVLGAVVMTYNLDGVDKPLKLTAENIAGIYLGEIKKWNDPKLAADNPDANLPDKAIFPVYRADSSGTTAVFTDFLAARVPAFKDKVGASKQPNWVEGVGSGQPRNDGVMGLVKQTPFSIGYVEIAFAKANDLPTALIKNPAGNFVEATIENVSAAAAGSAAKMPADMRISITNADGENSYPISSYTYILVYKDQKDARKGKALAEFLWWAVHDGSQFAKDLHYAPLPQEVVAKVEEKLKSITSGGNVLLENPGK